MAHELITIGERKFVVCSDTTALIYALKDIAIKLDTLLQIVRIKEEIYEKELDSFSNKETRSSTQRVRDKEGRKDPGSKDKKS
tara:strand:- start:1491 stop:1739 length:249 start_codon:yes stop_codon:yes gene_type:complete